MKNIDFNKLDYIEKRNIKFSDKYEDSKRLEFADFSLDKGNITDAVDIYVKLNKLEMLEPIIKEAIKNGDYFHYKYIHKISKKEMKSDEILSLIENAKIKGFARYVQEAQKYLEDLNNITEENDEDNKDKQNLPKKKKRQ